MPLTNLGSLLGLDFGSKRIGVAKSDTLGWTAQPLTTIARQGEKKDIATIVELVNQYEISSIVVGLPLNMNGSEGKAAETVRRFIAALQATLPIPVHAWDERLTTFEAEELLKQYDVKRKKRSQVIDKLAAVFILKSYMEAQKNIEKQKEDDF